MHLVWRSCYRGTHHDDRTCYGCLYCGVPTKQVRSLAQLYTILKRDLQAQFGRAWGLQGRRIDHENVAIGWELVHDATVLCPNYFLEDYGIETGDTVHAVIRDYDD